ncbi:IFG3 [Candida pseudojiufengensis]|uniref:IFG3 n=1 Tax=Candida pseudojiufengensis TaxID=497109 RepID=UPI002224356F|nr:IFG3 [Candida pseudojiufengensis]KAI5964072.1 IFG3 [Candida pseudojiufengensis]
MTKIVIVGSGIIGLYTAFTLIENGTSPNDISIIAEYLPGDESIKFTSPYAGGNFSCITGDDKETLEFDKYTYLNLNKVQSAMGKINGLDRYKSTEYWDEKPSDEKLNSLKSYLQEFEEIKEPPFGSAYGITFLSWNFNCPKFLLAFKQYLEKQGISFTKKKLTHIVQAYSGDTKIVFNCTGIGAKALVDDKNVYPGRGQVVVIKAPHIQENVLSWGNREPTYIIKRPFSHDQLILGGYYQKDDWNPDSLKEYTDSILKRTTTLFPKILSENPHGNEIKDLEILRVAVGLRPGRNGGVRIEKEFFDEGKILIHNYGASGYGYQAGLERLRKNQRALEKTQRELTREVTKLQQQEKKLISDIKKSAKQGQISSAKIQAKDLIRTKSYINKFNSMKAQLQAISLRVQSVRSNQQMAMSMRDATRVLSGMNRSMNLPQLSRIAQEFAKENDLMDQKQEFMDDAIDDAMAMDEDELGEEEQIDEILGKVLDEIGVDLNTNLKDTPSGITTNEQEEKLPQAIGEDDLQARLDSLKK